MRRGLVVGKFMPLHRGHELLIDKALAECDDVTVVVYDSRPPGSYPDMPVELRAGWLARLYEPSALGGGLEGIVALPDPLSPPESDLPESAHVYVEQLAFLGPFDRFYSSEPGYGPFAKLLGAEHRMLDEARELVPVSGTAIREDPYRHRGMISPAVYGSLIQRVALVGTESTGKTTLAREMASRLGTLWTHEYGRELWESQGLTGSFYDHLRMAERQRRREDAAVRHCRRFLFCDTTAWTTLHWSLRSYGCADPRLRALVDRTMGDYVWVLCDDDFGWVQDGTRELGEDGARAFQGQQLFDLRDRRVRFHRVSGPLESRVSQLSRLLGAARAATV